MKSGEMLRAGLTTVAKLVAGLGTGAGTGAKAGGQKAGANAGLIGEPDGGQEAGAKACLIGEPGGLIGDLLLASWTLTLLAIKSCSFLSARHCTRLRRLSYSLR